MLHTNIWINSLYQALKLIFSLISATRTISFANWRAREFKSEGIGCANLISWRVNRGLMLSGYFSPSTRRKTPRHECLGVG